ncbi:peptidase S41 family protein, partial [Trichophyton verrucosum HKI 0517]
AIAGLLLCVAGIASAVEPCGQVAEIQRERKKEDPDVTEFKIPANLAHACLLSVPFNVNNSLRLLDGLSYFWDSQSTKGWLPNPPKGYDLPPTDLDAGLEKIRQKALSGGYTGEYMFQLDLQTLVTSVHDGHFHMDLDLLTVFSFIRYDVGSLVSLSLRGKDFPRLYVLDDLKKSSKPSAIGNKHAIDPKSAVKTIDGEDSVKWMEEWSLNGGSQDRDALYNQMLAGLPRVPHRRRGGFRYPGSVYPGDKTTLGFYNGTVRDFSNWAFFDVSFTGVKDGETFYDKFCTGRDDESGVNRMGGLDYYFKESDRKTPRLISSPISNPQPPSRLAARELPPYVKPDVNSTDGIVEGYFLKNRFPRTAVLVVKEFIAKGNTTEMDLSYTIAAFLEQCRKMKTKKLIIDVSGNEGGLVFLGYDLFKQLVPNGKILTPSNMRATEQLNAVGTRANELLNKPLDPRAAEAENLRYSGYDLDTYITVDGTKFPSWPDLYGPEILPQDNYTHPTKWDLDNIKMTLATGPFIVSGYGNRTKIPPSPFSMRDMVIVTDGICASTCSIFTDLMRRHGSKFIAVGGRPQHGPMQAVGGVKGANVLTYRYLYYVIWLLYEKLSTVEERALLEKTRVGKMYHIGLYVLGRMATRGKNAAVNFRNAIWNEDKARTPRQFVYEPAECKTFFTPDALYDPLAWWTRLAKSWWGLKEICV